MDLDIDRSVELNGVSVDADSVGLSGYGAQYRVPADDVACLWVERGHTSRHPWMSLALGAALILIGCRVILHIVRWTIAGGVLWDVQVLMVLFLPLGAYLIYLAYHKGQVVRVVTKTGERVFAFSRSPKPEEVSEFIVESRDRFGYTVEQPPAPWR